MSTANFYSQENFKLCVNFFEAISMEEYEKEYFQDDDRCYPEYEATSDAEWKKELLEKSYNETMSFWEDIFYTDILTGADGFKGLMEDFNDSLTFHELTFKSGYYSGIQLYVEEKEENPHELDNDDCHYYYDMCRSKAIRKYDSEVRKINRWMDKIATQYGWKELNCVGIFSNGEAIYEFA